MPEITHKEKMVRVGSYPEGKVPVLFAYAFRPFFILLPLYLFMSIVLWGLLWSGYISLPPVGNPIVFHVYEMLFGIGSAGIIGFMLTAAPEFYEDSMPVVGKKLSGLVLLWIAGRIAFWFGASIGGLWVAVFNIPLLIVVVLVVAKPVFLDPLHKHVSLAGALVVLVIIQVWFFSSMILGFDVDLIRILFVAIGAFMVLELLVLRRVNTGVINEWIEAEGFDEVFMARPPRYNVAILTVIIFTIVEFLAPNDRVLGWLGLAAMAAVFNTFNDFFMDDGPIVFKPFVAPLFLILLLLGLGYGALGWHYLLDGSYGVNHLRHILTSGVFGLSFYMVMVIVATVHTGRALRASAMMNVSIGLILVATTLRVLIPLTGEYAGMAYLVSSVIWGMPFLLFLVTHYRALVSSRVDGLPG